MNKFVIACSFLMSTNFALANAEIPLDQQIKSVEIYEVTHHQKYLRGGLTDGVVTTGGEIPQETTGGIGGGGDTFKPDRLERTGKVIAILRDIVALGEDIYKLVQKGKPTNVTDFAPISIVPKDPVSKEYIEPFDLEGFSMPTEKRYTAIVKNGMNKEVVHFEYSIVYSYGGSYNGKGKYLTGVQIIPSTIKTSYGWDFNATMKLSGIMNHGTKENPVVGAILVVKYQMNSLRTSFERNDSIHITGLGELKAYNSK